MTPLWPESVVQEVVCPPLLACSRADELCSSTHQYQCRLPQRGSVMGGYIKAVIWRSNTPHRLFGSSKYKRGIDPTPKLVF